VVLNGIGGARKGEKMCRMTQEVAAKDAKNRFKCGQCTNLGALRPEIRCYFEVLTKLRESVRWILPEP
jgi:hypothetical protein